MVVSYYPYKLTPSPPAITLYTINW